MGVKSRNAAADVRDVPRTAHSGRSVIDPMGTWIVLILLGSLTVWAILKTVRRSRKGGGCCGDREETVKRIPPADRNSSHYPYRAHLVIGGMSCENCAVRIENALNALPGVLAKVDLSAKKAVVLLKEEPDERILRRAVTAAGYAVLSFGRDD